jgi:hypothetical protein
MHHGCTGLLGQQGKKVAWEGERAITAAWVGWAEIKGRFIIGFKF